MRGSYAEENLRYKEGNFGAIVLLLLCFILSLREISEYKPLGAHIRRGDSTEGFFCVTSLKGLFSEFYSSYPHLRCYHRHYLRILFRRCHHHRYTSHRRPRVVISIIIIIIIIIIIRSAKSRTYQRDLTHEVMPMILFESR